MKLVALVTVLAACHPYVLAGYDVTSKTTGPLSSMMSEPVATARQLPTTTAATPAATTAASTSPAHTYSLAFGFGTKDVGAEIGVHEYGATTSAFDMSDTSQRYVTTTGSVDLRWTYLRWTHVSAFVHAGPVVGAVVDKGVGSTGWGEGVRYGGGIAISMKVVLIYLDVSQTALQMASGDGSGFNQLTGITVGVGLH